jgi:Bacteriophage HK97-gp10, putative tail-component
MDITVEVQGLKGVEDALAQAGPKLAKRALRKALKAGGDLMVASAKSRAPLLKVATKRRQPGELRDSIGMKVAAIAPGSGFFAEAPKDHALPLWTYVSVSEVQPYALSGEHGFIIRRVQINCDGAIAADCIRLARAIDDVLSGFSGVLADGDATRVHGCFRTTLIDFFDDPGRTSRRIIEYEICFTQS